TSEVDDFMMSEIEANGTAVGPNGSTNAKTGYPFVNDLGCSCMMVGRSLSNSPQRTSQLTPLGTRIPFRTLRKFSTRLESCSTNSSRTFRCLPLSISDSAASIAASNATTGEPTCGFVYSPG